jgi:hypothetical protein
MIGGTSGASSLTSASGYDGVPCATACSAACHDGSSPAMNAVIVDGMRTAAIRAAFASSSTSARWAAYAACRSTTASPSTAPSARRDPC